jgi:hypothetical protein
MTKRMWWLFVFCAALLVSSGATPSGQTPATRKVMHDKLDLSNRVLASVMTSNLEALTRDTATLARITERPGWAVLTTPEYARYSGVFVAAAQALSIAAKERDLDTAAVRYAAMTMACYDCHRYVKRARQTKN